MKVKIDADLCTACEECVETCPEVFEMVDDIAKAKVDTVPDDAVDTCKEAAENCPVECIEIVD
jgi:ferredoxin